MDKIILADGTVIENAYVLQSIGRLWFYFTNGMNIREVFALMADPEKTERITMIRGETETVYEGYVSILNIMRDTGLVSGGLTRADE